MIISWFTQPPNGFSSYYQYDTVTGHFSRTRLELGRNSRSGRTNDTFVSYKPVRRVGFTTESYATRNYPGGSSPWRVNSQGELCYGTDVLASRPFPGAKVFDTSDPSGFIHRGNPVTEKPALPTGIKVEHLTLLANDSLASGTKLKLTKGSEPAGKLVEAIKKQVCRVLEVEPDQFDAITDDMIFAKLTRQAQDLRDSAADDSVQSMQKALDSAEDANDLINEQIEEGIITPNAQFEEAFGSLQTALSEAQDASGNDVRLALETIRTARQSLGTAIKNVDTAAREAANREFEGAAESLALAEEHAIRWELVEAEYRPLTEAKTLDEYTEYLETGTIS